MIASGERTVSPCPPSFSSPLIPLYHGCRGSQIIDRVSDRRSPKWVNDRDRGEPRGSAPPTPPGIRVRTTAVREVALTRVEQGRETERFEVGIGEPHRERFAPGKVPRATAAAGHIAQL